MSRPTSHPYAVGQVWTADDDTRQVIRVEDGPALNGPTLQYRTAEGVAKTILRQGFSKWARDVRAVQS